MRSKDSEPHTECPRPGDLCQKAESLKHLALKISREYVKDVAVGDQHIVLKGFINKLTSSKLQHRGSTRSTWVI